MVFLCGIFRLLTLQAQDLDSTMDMARNALVVKQYADAELLWMRAAFFGKSDSLWESSAALAEVYFQEGRYAEAAEAFDYAARLAPTDSLLQACTFRAAAAGLQVKNYADVRKRLENMGPLDDSLAETRRQFYLGSAAYGMQDFVMAEAHWGGCTSGEFELARLKELFEQHAKLKSGHAGIAIALSQLIPGLGQLYIGHPGKALNSLVLVGVIVGGGIYLGAVVGIADALLLFLPPFIRYYEGGAIRAGKDAKSKLEQRKLQILEQMLEIVGH